MGRLPRRRTDERGLFRFRDHESGRVVVRLEVADFTLIVHPKNADTTVLDRMTICECSF